MRWCVTYSSPWRGRWCCASRSPLGPANAPSSTTRTWFRCRRTCPGHWTARWNTWWHEKKNHNTCETSNKKQTVVFGMECLKSTIQRVCVHLCDKPSAVWRRNNNNKKLQMIFVGVLLLPNWRREHAAAGQPSRTVSRERHADRDEEDVEQKPVYVTVSSQAEAVALTCKSWRCECVRKSSPRNERPIGQSDRSVVSGWSESFHLHISVLILLLLLLVLIFFFMLLFFLLLYLLLLMFFFLFFSSLLLLLLFFLLFFFFLFFLWLIYLCWYKTGRQF